MKNNIILIGLIFKIFFSTIVCSNSTEPFNFDVTEVEILEEGHWCFDQFSEQMLDRCS